MPSRRTDSAVPACLPGFAPPTPHPAPPCSRPSIVSTAEFEADKASLLRMLEDFNRDHPQAAAALTALASDSSTSSSSSNSAGVVTLDPQALDFANIDAVNKGMQVIGPP